MSYTDDKLKQIWGKARKVRGKDPDTYRKDCEGNVMYRHSYGKCSQMGWEVDHSKPKAKGGTDHLNNLQPLHWNANRKKGCDY